MKVLCRRSQSDDTIYDLTPGEPYEVIAIEAGDYRILDDVGRPYLFPAELFRVINPARPAHWVSETLDDVEYASAPELAAPGFFEDFFSGEPDAVRASIATSIAIYA